MDKTLKALKEVGEYLGKKLDIIAEVVRTSPQAIRIDMGDATKRMEETASSATDLMKSMDSFIEDEKVSREQTLAIISSVQKAVESQSNALASYDSSPRLEAILSELKTQTKAVKDNKIELKPDSKLHTLLKEAISAIQSIPEAPEIDLKPLEKAIKGLETSLKPKEVKIDLSTLTTKLDDISKKLDKNDPIKIDQEQLRSLRSAGGMPTFGGQLSARSVRTTNVSLALANTEYSYTFPANTVAWELKLRDQGTLGYYSFTTGTMPSGGDSSNYVTIPQNFVKSREGVEWSGKIIYIGAESASQVAELTVYTA